MKIKKVFKTKLELMINTKNELPNDIQDATDYLIQCIKSCSELGNKSKKKTNKKIKKTYIYKEVWFEYECFKLRKTVFKLLKIIRRSNSEFVRSLYLDANKRYKQICKQKHKAYYENLIFNLAKVKNSTDFWSIINKLKNK